MSAPLLRKLLMDREPLVHEANRVPRLKLLFVVSDMTADLEAILEDKPSFWASLEGVSPRLGPPGRTKTVNLDGLLAERVMIIGNHDINIGDIISEVANIEGAVHLGKPKTDKEQILAVTNSRFQIVGVDAVVRALRGIGAVVVDGLLPLARTISQHP